MHNVNEQLYFSVQIQPDDLPALKAAGIGRIICHRPDGESPDQADFAQIAQAAEREGIVTLYCPVAGAIPATAIEATWQALQDGTPTLMYCRSGTRSCMTWALGEAAHGADIPGLLSRAAQIGYDLSPIRQALEEIAGA